MGESEGTPKKFRGSSTLCFICSNSAIIREKIYIFGKTSVDLHKLVYLAVDINLADDSENRELFVCRKQCYSKLLQLNSALNKVERIKSELYKQFKEKNQGETRFKRLRHSETDNLEAGKETSRKVAKALRFPYVQNITENTSENTCSSSIGFDDITPSDNVPSTNDSNLGLSEKTSSDLKVNVTIKYPSKTVRKALNKQYETIAKALLNGSPLRIATAIMKCPQVCDMVVSKILDKLRKEVSMLCSRKNPSMLRKTSKEDLTNFKLESLGEEWKTRAPLFYSFLMTASVKKKKSSLWLPSMSLAGSIILKQRNVQMNATAIVMSILMKMGAQEATLTRFTKLKLTTSNKVTLEKLDALGVDHDIQLKTAKETITNENIQLKALREEKEIAYNKLQLSGQHTRSVSDIKDLGDRISKLKKSSHPGFTVSFDNVDIYLQRRNMTIRAQNSDFHWINHKMVENRVGGNHLDNTKPAADIMTVEDMKYLPSMTDNEKQRMDYMILTSRILTEYFDALKPLKEACIMHIPHKYSKELSKKSKKVPLGIVFKNENVNEEMLSVLRQFHTYLPVKGNGEYDGQLFAGDQLSIERAANVISSVANGYNAEDRLEGMNLQLGDWHACVKLLSLIYERFYNCKSDGDSCTMYSDRTLINRRNVKSETKHAYRANRDFFIVLLKSRVIAASMKVLQLESRDSKFPNHLLPDNVDLLSKSEKLKLLLDISAKVVDQFIFDQDFSKQMVDGIILQQEKENALNQHKTADGRFPCRFKGCKKSFKYNGKSKKNHELSHDPPVEMPDEICELSPTKPDLSECSVTKDDFFNYNTALLADGFLFQNFLDAISEGDGDRIMRQYKYIMLYCREDGGSNKYALECLYQLFLTSALLSRRDRERFIWNRSVNNFCKPGTNIPLDLDVEHSNNFVKQAIKNLGPNVSENAVARICKAENSTTSIMKNIDISINHTVSSGLHSEHSVDEDVDKLVERLMKADVFTYNDSGRTYTEFSNFQRNRLASLKLSETFKWIKKHKKNVSSGMKAR